MADGRVVIETLLDTNGLSRGLAGVGSIVGKGLGIAAAGVTAAATAVGALTSQAVGAYGQYEQLVGGIETLFGAAGMTVEEYARATNRSVGEASRDYARLMQAQETLFENADNAYYNAGLSANEYMEMSIAFSASLIQSLEGDTVRAAQLTDVAINDMADNVNKMGTTMESVQNAYRGFSRGNFMMLDNLSLGYSGTRTEMQRLLADANALNEAQGIYTEYSIDSYADIVEAIHVVQESIGITGTTTEEAAETIEGSTRGMRAAWDNLIAGIGKDNVDLDKLIQRFVNSANLYVQNMLPRVAKVLNGIGDLFTEILPVVLALIPELINDYLPELLDSGVQLVSMLGQGILTALPLLAPIAIDLVVQLATMLISNLPQILTVGIQVLNQLGLGIARALPTLIPLAVDAILTLVDALLSSDNIGTLIDTGIEVLLALLDGIIEALPIIAERAPEIVEKLVSAIEENADKLEDAAVTILVTLGQALIDYLPDLLEYLPEFVNEIVYGIAVLCVEFASLGEDIVTAICDGLDEWWQDVVDWAGQKLDDLKTGWIYLVQEGGFEDVGRAIVDGLVSGLNDRNPIVNAASTNLIGGIIQRMRSAGGIHSPSKKTAYLGRMLGEGLIEGFDDSDAMTEIQATMTSGLNRLNNLTFVPDVNTTDANGYGGYTQIVNINKEVSTPDDIARALRLEQRYFEG